MFATEEEIRQRYSKSETVADTRGRLFKIQNLRFSEQLAVRRMAETEDNFTIMCMMIAASVRGYNDLNISFPRTLAELNSTIDILDEEGMAAIVPAFAKLRGVVGEGDEDPAKKLQPAPDSKSSVS